MFIDLGQDGVDRRYYAALYWRGCLAELPWGEEPFDCIVFLCDPICVQALGADLSVELVRTNVDWVAVAGDGAEELHDILDHASIAAGRQQAIGDGSPMTSWHTGERTIEDMAELASFCLCGGHDYLLVFVVGQESDFQTSVEAVRRRLINYGC